MSFTDEPDPDQQSKTVTMSRKDIRRLEEQAKEGREAKERLAQLERERTFINAGVPLDDKRANYFMAGYQGEQTPETIRAEWSATFGGQQATEQEHQIDQELAALNAAQDMTTAAPNIPPDKLAERNRKLDELSPTDPRYDEKFNAIFDSYGGKRGGLVG